MTSGGSKQKSRFIDSRWMSWLKSLGAFVRYNASNIFAGRFIYFLFLAIALFLTVVVIYALDEETPPTAEAVYYFLLVPGALLVFYPSAYSIQADVDAGMAETLFGIPDYRYKVWLARNLSQYVVIAILLLMLALFCRAAMADFSVSSMLFQVMFPVLFLGSLGFMIATLLRSGNAAAVIMILLVLALWIAEEPLEESRWNLFHNPFKQVDIYQTLAWMETTLFNRVYILVGSLVSIMLALLRLQKREKFI
ncbi:MAG: hypothetical protein JSU65_05330 [Candidatus Zixiibacteriota bacterium]|nr:MAG: hypothetical protein JSU65_05330 [candidate division Zixibacteria bacterium]